MCQGTTAIASNNQDSTKDHVEQDDPILTRNDSENSTSDLDSEREVWEFMTPQAWHNSVASEGSIFRPTYQATIDTLRKTAEEGGYDVILEVGCGTGDIIGLMNEQKPLLRTSITNLKGLIDGSSKQEQMVATTIPCIGVDINKDFIDFCQKQHPYDSCSFVVADALLLQEWWIINGYNKKYNKPLVICVNNTLNIMPNELRGGVVDQMIAVAGNDGLCMVSYWNGKFLLFVVVLVLVLVL
jgi:SAM-dependent methyltransferase